MKKKELIIIGLLIFSSIGFASAQVYQYLGDKVFGSTANDNFPRIHNNENGTFLIAGASFGNISGNKTEPLCDSLFTGLWADIWILKIDTAFNLLWNKSYGGNKREELTFLLKMKNSNNIMLTTSSNSDSSCEKSSNSKGLSDYWILTIDSNGNKIKDYNWGGNNTDWQTQTIELPSENIITCGMSSSAIGFDKTVNNHLDSTGAGGSDYWVVKQDTAGNKLWDKVFGGSKEEFAFSSSYATYFKILNVTNDDFIIAGTTNSPKSGDISDSCRGYCTYTDIWIIKIDSAGNKIWDKRYGGSGVDICNNILATNDQGYLLCGSTDSPNGYDVSDSTKGGTDCWVLKLDSFGNKQWDKRYGGNKNDYATWIEKALDGGYWISGQTASDSSGDVTEPKYSTQSGGEYWIFKIDENGNKIFDKRFGGPGINYGSAFTIAPDSTIFLIGSAQPGINAVKSDSGRGQLDYWIVHFKYTCTSTATISPVACNSYQSPSGNYNWTSSGVYTDTLTNVTGCDSIITINLTINNATTAAQSITACYSYTSPSGNYNWTASGIYNDTIPNAAGCDSVIIVNLTINTVDTSVTANAPNLSSNATGAAYQWMYCDSSLIAGATNQSYNATANGWYAVMVVQNGCEDTSACYLVLNVGMDENENEDLLNIYPNPTDDAVTITSATMPIKSIELTDVIGQTLFQQTINNRSAQVHLDNYPKGFYFIKITGEKYSVIKKVIRL